MIVIIKNIRNEILTSLKTSLPTFNIYSFYPNIEYSFPSIIINVYGVSTKTDTIDSSGVNHNMWSLSVDMLSNSETPLSELDEMEQLVDTVLSGEYKFTLESSDFEYDYDESYHRRGLTYSFVIGKDNTIYRG